VRALVCERLEGIGALRVRDDWPEQVMGDDTVRVRMTAAALNFPDLLMTEGLYQHRAEAPYIPGLEGAGVVVAVAQDLPSSWVGRRVMVSTRGTFAAEVVVRPDDLHEVPPGWTDAEAAAFRVVGITAFHALVHRARVQAGDTVLVTGAAGGTGHMAVKMAKALGARVIGVVRTVAKAEAVRALGADHVVLAEGEDLADRIKSTAGGRGVDVVFDPVGGAVFDAALKATAPGGRIAIVGFAGGAPNSVKTNYALIKGLTLLGIRAGEAARQNPAVAADYREALARLAVTHDLRPVIGATYAFVDAPRAFVDLAVHGTVGKIVVSLDA
jgi:NADPH:quinone reductase